MQSCNWLKTREVSDWLQSSLLKKMHLWIQPHQESLKNPHINTDPPTDSDTNTNKFTNEKRLVNSSLSLYINVTTSIIIHYHPLSNTFLMKIANIFVNSCMYAFILHLFKRRHLCGDQKCVCATFLFMDLFYIYTYRYPFVSALKCICDKRVI